MCQHARMSRTVDGEPLVGVIKVSARQGAHEQGCGQA